MKQFIILAWFIAVFQTLFICRVEADPLEAGFHHLFFEETYHQGVKNKVRKVNKLKEI